MPYGCILERNGVMEVINHGVYYGSIMYYVSCGSIMGIIFRSYTCDQERVHPPGFTPQ